MRYVLEVNPPGAEPIHYAGSKQLGKTRKLDRTTRFPDRATRFDTAAEANALRKELVGGYKVVAVDEE